MASHAEGLEVLEGLAAQGVIPPPALHLTAAAAFAASLQCPNLLPHHLLRPFPSRVLAAEMAQALEDMPLAGGERASLEVRGQQQPSIITAHQINNQISTDQ